MPLYWMFTTSLKDQAAYMAQPPEMMPADPTLANFGQLFANPNMLRWIFNSAFVALSVTGLNLIFATLAGVLCMIGWGGLGYATSLPMLYVLYVTAGIGAALIYGGCMGSSLKWFST